ncbi:hypothetical protein AB0N73_03045 [Microbacterium sp. NPDC089189]|uniref:hypothetical protein n=1 Tax=Microbacterium sp. NPDC089189 TaxID=3154972 RepID=UPI00341CBA5D
MASLKPDQRALLIADVITPSLRQIALQDDRLVVVSVDSVMWDRQAVALSDAGGPTHARAAGRRPYGRFAVARALLAAEGPLTQQQLVTGTGITQAAVSRALSSSFFDGVLERAWGGTRVADRGALFERAVADYPGPAGVTTYWWHGTSAMEQADVLAAADETALVSGDIAADRMRAWRTPEHAVVYTRAQPNLRDMGYSLADSSDYTLMLVHPDDHTIWPTARAWEVPGTADPVIASFDVARTGTRGDHIEAVDRIREYVIGARQR